MVVVILFCAFLSVSDAGRILVWIPTPSISHQVVYRPLSQELAKRGHQVVVITTDPAFPEGETPPNLTEIDIHNVTYNEIRTQHGKLPKGKKSYRMNDYINTANACLKIFDSQLNHPLVKKIIVSQQTFDLFLIESTFLPVLAMAHFFKGPVIGLNSLGPTYFNLEHIGAPLHPIHFPTTRRQKLINMTIWNTLQELYNHFKIDQYFKYNLQILAEKTLQKHFSSKIPRFDEVANNIDMLFVNMHPVFTGNHPMPPGLVYTWGIHQYKLETLSQELQSYLDRSKRGVIYMSFGNNVDSSSIPSMWMNIFMTVFCDLPYDVLLKWDTDEIPGRCENVKTARWFPQPNILRHSNLKLFITHGGLQSTEEAIASAVPLVGIPMSADQWYNVERYVKLKIGIHLDVETLTKARFRNVVITAIEDESYRHNIKRLNALLRDQKEASLKRAVWWCEHILRHGHGRHLRSPTANIYFLEYYEIELLAIVFFTILLVTSIILMAAYSILNFVMVKVKKS